MLLLNIMQPSVYKNDTLQKYYSQFLLPIMFGQPCTSALVNWKNTTFSFYMFSKTLAVFIFWFQFHFYLICLCVSKLRLRKLCLVHKRHSNLFSSVIPSNTEVVFLKKIKPLKWKGNVSWKHVTAVNCLPKLDSPEVDPSGVQQMMHYQFFYL